MITSVWKEARQDFEYFPVLWCKFFFGGRGSLENFVKL